MPRVLPQAAPRYSAAPGLQQVTDVLFVHLEQEIEVRLKFDSLGGSWEKSWVPLQDLAQQGVPHDPPSGTSFHQEQLMGLRRQEQLPELCWAVPPNPLLSSQEALTALWSTARKRKAPCSSWQKPAAPVHCTGWVILCAVRLPCKPQAQQGTLQLP